MNLGAEQKTLAGSSILDRPFKMDQDMSFLFCRSLKAATGFSAQRTLHFSLVFHSQDEQQSPLINELESDPAFFSSYYFQDTNL